MIGAAGNVKGWPPADNMVRLLVLNAQHSSPARAGCQAAWIADQEDADFVILTEVGTGPGGTALTAALAAHGYHSVLAPDCPARDYCTVLASRGAALAEIPTGIRVLSHRAQAATATVAGQTIGLLGLYVPSRGPRERRNQDKRAFQEEVTRALPAFLARASGPVIAAGDLNVIEPDHVPHYPVFGQWEYDFYQAFANSGMTDAYRKLNPSSAGHSWYGRGGNGYRFDHAFITSRDAAALRSCQYLTEPVRERLTDHAALSLTLVCSADSASRQTTRVADSSLKEAADGRPVHRA